MWPSWDLRLPWEKNCETSLRSPGFRPENFLCLKQKSTQGCCRSSRVRFESAQIISPEALADTDIAFFACSPEIIEAYAASGSAFPDLTIDLTQTGRKGILFLKGVSESSRLQGAGYYVNPHPAAIAIGRVLARIQSAFHLESASVTILTPASERGTAAINELQEQTVELLNFQSIESKVFGGQLAFNLLPEIETARHTEQPAPPATLATCWKAICRRWGSQPFRLLYFILMRVRFF